MQWAADCAAPGNSRGHPARAGIRTHNLGLPWVSSPMLYPLGHDCPCKHHHCESAVMVMQHFYYHKVQMWFSSVSECVSVWPQETLRVDDMNTNVTRDSIDRYGSISTNAAVDPSRSEISPYHSSYPHKTFSLESYMHKNHKHMSFTSSGLIGRESWLRAIWLVSSDEWQLTSQSKRSIWESFPIWWSQVCTAIEKHVYSVSESGSSLKMCQMITVKFYRRTADSNLNTPDSLWNISSIKYLIFKGSALNEKPVIVPWCCYKPAEGL